MHGYPKKFSSKYKLKNLKMPEKIGVIDKTRLVMQNTHQCFVAMDPDD